MAIAFLNSIIGWLLGIHPALSILIISFVVSVITTVSIKLFTDQGLMKDLRNEMNELQKELKELKNNPKKMTKINERFMETNMKYMSHSMRPTLFTFIPLILVFSWMNSSLGYSPIMPGERFTVAAHFEKGTQGELYMDYPSSITQESKASQEIINDMASWSMTAKEGKYLLNISFMNKTYQKDLIVSSSNEYAPVEKDFKKSFILFSSPGENGLNKITLSNKKILIFADVPIIKDIPWISTWTWFGGYILFSLIFSMAFRKMFSIY
jgi:uncharacterized membrane protein (DUF106 family)